MKRHILGAKTTFVFFTSLLALPLLLKAQSDNFNDGNDTANPAWTHYEPLSGFGSGGTWTFPGGNSYHIQALTPSPDPGTLGPARVASVLTNVYSKFYISVDVVDWNDTLDQAFGILARLENIGLGTTTGYVFTYQAGDHDVSISKITGEAASDLPGTSTSVTLDPANDYRFVFMGSGPYFEGRVYQLPDTTTPIVVITATDSTYTSGQAGLLVYDNSGSAGTADAIYDNYFASDHDPKLVFDDFNDGNDTAPPPAWVHHDPIADAGIPGACYSGATFTFPGGGYRLFSPLPCVTDAGGPRAVSLREETTWSDFYISVDALNWDDTIHQLFGIVARASNVGPGTTDAYLFTWEDGSDPLPNTTGGDLDVLRIQGEGATEAHQMEHDIPNQDSGLHLTNGNSYRFVFIGKGYDFEARIYQLPDVTNPIKQLLAIDTLTMFPSGTIGLIVADHPSDSPFHAASATFDNFSANTAEPRLTITPGDGQVDLTWPLLADLWVLESTPSLTPPITWTPVTTGISHVGLTNSYSITAPTDNRFYRLARP